MVDPRLTRRETLWAAAAGGAALAGLRAGVPAIGTARSATSLATLERRLRGSLITPGESGYGAAAAIWNPRLKIRPRAIAFCRNAGDVAQVVRFACERGWPITARSGRHSFEGYCNTTGIVCDVSAMDAAHFDDDRGTVTVGAGANNLSVYEDLILAKGLAVPTGTCPTVGVGGLTLGGGLSRMTRLNGMLIDNLVGAEVVLPSGRKVHASAKSNPDLFWALRGGGGGNFGIATSFTYRTHPTPDLVNWGFAFDWAKGPEALDAWQGLVPYAPPELGSVSFRATKTPKPPGPDVLAVSCGGLWYGKQSDLEDLIAPLRAVGPLRQNVDVIPFKIAWQPDGCKLGANNSVTCPSGNLGPNYQKSDFVAKQMSIAGIQKIFEQTARWPGGGGAHEGGIQIEALGPPCYVNKIKKDKTAWVHRDSLYHIVYLNFWGPNDGRNVAHANIQWARDFYAEMRPYVSGYAYQNYIDRGLKSWRSAYYGTNYKRLRKVKRRYDPDWLLRFPQGIQPA